MNLRRLFIHTYLYIPYFFSKITRTGAFGKNGAEFINEANPPGGNGLKAGLWKHHVKQFHGASCSVATVVSAVNALRDRQQDSPVPITQQDILDKVRTAHWKERMSPEGHNGRRGLPLPVFGDVVKSSLDEYKINYKTMETIQTLKNSPESDRVKQVLRERLHRFETQGDCLILIHFDQGAYVPALNIPHISPVGGFDPESGIVTILDVDITQERPYKISFDTFYKGLSSSYHHVLRPFGFASGGYVFVKIP